MTTRYEPHKRNPDNVQPTAQGLNQTMARDLIASRVAKLLHGLTTDLSVSAQERGAAKSLLNEMPEGIRRRAAS